MIYIISKIDEKEKTQKTFYEKGMMYKKINMPGASMRAFLNCIEFKEALSYKACFELSKIYAKLKDYAEAYNYCMQAIMMNPQYIEPLYYIVHIVKLAKAPIEELREKFESLFSDSIPDYTLMSDIFYMEGFYEQALEYINKCKVSDSIELLKVKCLLRSARYVECLQYIDTVSQNNLYFFTIMMFKVVCFIIINEYESAWNILRKFNFARLNTINQKVFSVYVQLYNLVTDRDTSILCENEHDEDYTSCILEVCDILLTVKEFDCFEKILNLFNLISDKSVLLQLGKLYYKHGFIDMARKELIRSIKEFEIFDSDGLDILR